MRPSFSRTARSCARFRRPRRRSASSEARTAPSRMPPPQTWSDTPSLRCTSASRMTPAGRMSARARSTPKRADDLARRGRSRRCRAPRPAPPRRAPRRRAGAQRGRCRRRRAPLRRSAEPGGRTSSSASACMSPARVVSRTEPRSTDSIQSGSSSGEPIAISVEAPPMSHTAMRDGSSSLGRERRRRDRRACPPRPS